MSVNRVVWRTLFDEQAFPGLPCPHCPSGKVKLVPGSIYKEEPTFSIAYHNDEDFEPDWAEDRFTARLVCDENGCGEIVHMIGDTTTVEVMLTDAEDGYDGWGIQRVYRPRAAFPPPPLFWVPPTVPHSIRKQLRLAFQMFWADLPASVGRLRTAVELMLDDHQIASEALAKSGKAVHIPLGHRIDAFAATKAGDSLKEPLEALRDIGNLGTHGTSVDKEAYFDAVDVLEDVLLGVYETKSIKAKVAKLKATKGSY